MCFKFYFSIYLIILREAVVQTCCAQASNFIKKETLAQVFSCEFCEISKNTSYRTPPVAASVLIYFMNFIKFDFIFKFFLFQHRKTYTLYKVDCCFKLFTLTAWYFLSKIALTKICFRDITLFTSLVFFLPSLRRMFIQQMWVTQLHDSLANDFFQSPFEANEMFCLLNKFVLITNHKQLLKCF